VAGASPPLLATAPAWGEKRRRGAGPQLSPRDRAVVEAVRTFRQLTADQIVRLFFAEGEAATQRAKARRCLRRLVEAGVVGRIKERSIGGWANGSQGYCYVPPKSTARIRDPHTLDIAELYVRLRAAERRGRCEVLAYEPERRVEGFGFIPDAAVRLRVGERRRQAFVEVDNGTESKALLAAKVVAYELAYGSWDRPIFPRVIFTVADVKQHRVITQLIAESAVPQLFQACGFDEVVDLLTGTNLKEG
jgi:hypothetical protein